MSDVNRNKPELRFSGYTGDWEQRKLGEVGTTYTGLSGKSSADFGHGEACFITYMNVYSNAIADPDMVDLVEIDSRQNEVEVGDVFFTTSSETPEEVGMSSVLLEKREHTYLNSFCFGYRPNIAFDFNYLAYMLRSNKIRTKIVYLAQGISRYNISKNKMMDIEIPIPSMPEQKEIGFLFKYLDDLITLHNKKCDELKLYKKGLLQQLFSQPGEMYPHVRFPSFDGPWHQRKFEDIFTVSQGLQIPISERYLESGKNRYFYITNEFLKENCKEAYYIESPSESVVCDEEDILMTRTGNTGIVVTDVSGCFHNNFFKIKYDKKAYSKRFICYLLSSPSMHRIIMNSAGSSTIPDLSHKNFYKIEAAFPESKEEQEHIGQLLFEMDKLISLHQQKCNELQNYKNGLLQKMFI